MDPKNLFLLVYTVKKLREEVSEESLTRRNIACVKRAKKIS